MSDIDKFSDQCVRGVWREAWSLKVRANRHHFYSQREATNAHAHELDPLDVGAKVFVENQHGNHPLMWDKTGTVVELLPNSAYQVKMDGSGSLAKRTRQHLRRFQPFDVQPVHPMMTTPYGPAALQDPALADSATDTMGFFKLRSL